MKTKNLVISAILIAIGFILPILFHTFGLLGPIFLPMHLSVLMGGFLLLPHEALLVGIATPILSSIFTGMPMTSIQSLLFFKYSIDKSQQESVSIFSIIPSYL